MPAPVLFNINLHTQLEVLRASPIPVMDLFETFLTAISQEIQPMICLQRNRKVHVAF